jgi:hypothetical protein
LLGRATVTSCFRTATRSDSRSTAPETTITGQ